ncbi:MAG: hydrogenase small subunit [Dehalococcoidales bacterium]|nr:hydrogenase small subunit [Dehalococcoidales bacterium]
MVIKGEVTRRDFLKLAAGSTAALGLGLFSFPNFEKLFSVAVAEVPVIWLQASSCSGCSVSVLNSLSPKIQDVLLGEVVPGNHLSLRFHPTIMAASGHQAMQALEDTAREKRGSYVLVVEGAIPTRDNGVYCEIGESNALDYVSRLGSDAMAVLALGTCAAYGGIAAAKPNLTKCRAVKEVFATKGIGTPVINLPGCPPHPDWFVSTAATILIGGLGAVDVDGAGKPTAFYGKLIHDLCPRRSYFDKGKFAQKLSEPYCLFALGCKGTINHSDCPIRLWNSGTNWCVGSNSSCIGCCEPGFPDELWPLFRVTPMAIPTPEPTPIPMPPPVVVVEKELVGVSPAAAAGIAAGSAVVGAATATALSRRLRKGKEEREE